ncbi:MAG: S1 RNA-binding domain-containing protein, partial [Fibrobacterales bacterium]|nr:S1 RNA-binding domain-containing protein [Fibrobacterales bacterium]
MSEKITYGDESILKEIEAAEARFEGRAAEGEGVDQYFDTMSGLEPGKVVKGTVLKIDDQEVLVDVAFKSEGSIPRSEFKDMPDLKVGDVVEIYIEELEDDHGQLRLSKQRADFIRVWEKIRAAYENNEVVRGKLVRRIKGGVVVDLFGIEAFLPGSQIDLRQIPDINALLDQEFDLKVIKVNKARRNIVVSRRVVLEE